MKPYVMPPIPEAIRRSGKGPAWCWNRIALSSLLLAAIILSSSLGYAGMGPQGVAAAGGEGDRAPSPFWANEIDYNESLQVLSHLTLTVDPMRPQVVRVTDPEELLGYDTVFVLGGHEAPTDAFMPVNIADDLLSGEQKGSIASGTPEIITATEDARTYHIFVGADRDGTSYRVRGDLDNDIAET